MNIDYIINFVKYELVKEKRKAEIAWSRNMKTGYATSLGAIRAYETILNAIQLKEKPPAPAATETSE